ncbi:hypothetical protein M422DRAFT_182305, partial [Sphaerobolus stellatus SS14]
VENCLFKVPRIMFEVELEVFRDLFSLPTSEDDPSSLTEGINDDKPIRLEQVSSADFKCLVDYLYPL